MAFKLVSSGGNVVDPSVVSVYASGTVHRGGLVEYVTPATTAMGMVSPASASSTQTTIFGICQDYAEGASDVKVRVIPINSDQLWEADCTSNTGTLHVFKKHLLTDDLTVANTDYDISGVTGIFLAVNVRGAAADKKIIGQFQKRCIAHGTT